MKELIEFVAKKLVAHPEDVQVRVIEGEDETTLELSVHDEDMGRIIGKEGRTAKALRTLLNSATTKSDDRISLQIVE
jgi:uncharacterized protein